MLFFYTKEKIRLYCCVKTSRHVLIETAATSETPRQITVEYLDVLVYIHLLPIQEKCGCQICNRRGNENFLIVLPRVSDVRTEGCVTVRTSVLTTIPMGVFFDYLNSLKRLLRKG
ncbi:hypothetical protein NPIL_112871 [Nephila pilipes]|uniref:Uncharacterized protein n=1 Tax=Nephila pilipes TaxID=299642 RepID=A0A8X6Q0R1_NEPPI|nr:hypothetical protein NPIL_112871 [Nephila pilipes]